MWCYTKCIIDKTFLIFFVISNLKGIFLVLYRGKQQVYFRVVCGLQIKNVSAINYKKYSANVPFLNLLAITHKEKRIFLHFSKSIEIILNCEKMSVLIEDIDVPWPTKLKPKHDIK